MTARRKLAWMLADQAPAASSPVQEMRPGQAIEAALTAVGYDKPAAVQEWLRQRGVRVSKSHVYNIRNRGPRPATDHDQQPVHRGLVPATSADHADPVHRVEHATDEHGLRPLPPRGRPGVKPVLRDRARAAGQHYRDQHGRLPTSSELAEQAGVSSRTAAKVLRQLRSDRPALSDPAGIGRGVDYVEDTRPPVTDQASPRHRVPVRRQAVHSMPPARAATGHQSATHGRPTASAARRGEASLEGASDATGPPQADVSIARARMALAVLNAHRAEQHTRRSAEQARIEQLNRWHHNARAEPLATRDNNGWGYAR
jgi:hypothetical protein